MKSELRLDSDVFDAADGNGGEIKVESKNVKIEKTEIKSEHESVDGVSIRTISIVTFALQKRRFSPFHPFPIYHHLRHHVPPFH